MNAKQRRMGSLFTLKRGRVNRSELNVEPRLP
jgi:hypothetical protein